MTLTQERKAEITAQLRLPPKEKEEAA